MQHPIVSHDEWLTARKALFDKERAMTHALDDLRAERRRLPWVSGRFPALSSARRASKSRNFWSISLSNMPRSIG